MMECIGAGVVFFACLFAVLDRDNIGPGLAGLSVSFALQVRLGGPLLLLYYPTVRRGERGVLGVGNIHVAILPLVKI